MNPRYMTRSQYVAWCLLKKLLRLLLWGGVAFLIVTFILALFGGCDAKAEPIVKPKPVARVRFDSGWWTRSLAIASAYDGATTRLTFTYGPRYGEGEPVSRVLLGARPSAPRLALMGGLEVAGVAFIPNRTLRRITQVALIGAHAYFGTRNLCLPHNKH